MKRVLVFLSLAIAPLLQAMPVSLESGNITYDAPDGFTPLTPAELDRKFPMRRDPVTAVGNETRGVTICYAETKNALRPEQLGACRDAVVSQMTQLMPSLKWIKNDLVMINGTQWMYLESTTQAPEDNQEIHNIELGTSYNGVLVVFNFNSSSKLFDTYQAKLQASIQSVNVKRP